MSNSTFPGARWFKFEFHCHTKASSDYGKGLGEDTLKARSHEEWVLDYMRAGLDCVAITDHNCGDAIDEVKAAVESLRTNGHEDFREITIFPGAELTVNGAHYLAIFDPSSSTETVKEILTLLEYNKAENNASGYCKPDVTWLVSKITGAGGICIPAHVDSPKGVFTEQSSLSSIEPLLKSEVFAMEVIDENYTAPGIYTAAKTNWSRILGSDSHHPTGDTTDPNTRYPGSHFTWVKMGTPSIESLKLALIDGNGVSLIRSSDPECPETPNEAPALWLKSLTIDKSILMGNQSPEVFQLSPWFNTIVGGRGSGKSSIVHFLRAILDRSQDLETHNELGQESLVFKTYRDFYQVNADRRSKKSLGALKAETKSLLEVSKDDFDYRISHDSNQNREVEEWEEMLDDWIPNESEEVHKRFPVRIFSQNEIATISSNPNALLDLIDSQIAKSDWADQHQELSNDYKRLSAELRSISTNHNKLGELKTTRKDIERNLKKYEDEGNKQILTTYNTNQNILKIVKSEEDKVVELSKLLAKVLDAESPIPESSILDIPEELKQYLTECASLVTEAQETIGALKGSLDAQYKALHDKLKQGDWAASYQKNKTAHDALAEEFEKISSQGKNGYNQLKQEQEKISDQITHIEKEIEKEARLKTEVEEKSTAILEVREQLTELRKAFLNDTLSGNRFVRITVIPFGDSVQEFEESFRRLIDREDTTFEKDIYYKGDGDPPIGLIQELLEGLDDKEESERKAELLVRFENLKRKLVETALGQEGHFRAKFNSYLKKHQENNPEFASRIQLWTTEDALQVEYSPGGNGRDFTELAKGSTGQKSAALLAFILSFGSEPLILDQPEDDLDNALITELICRQIRENKSRRQIIVITHNPNIVVNADAEMIHALNFTAGQCRIKSKGALQDPNVRTDVCDIMEGGKPAIESRYRRLV